MGMILWTRAIREGLMEDLSAFSAKPRLRLLLDHFSKIKDTRQAWKVAYPLCEVLFLVVCGTIAGGDDYEDIVDWGEAHLSFLRGFAEFHHGIPCADWLAYRDEPDQSGAVCGLLFVVGRGMLAGQARSRGDRRQDLAPQPRPKERPKRPSWNNAMGCNPNIAQSILDAKADYLLARERQPDEAAYRYQKLFRYSAFRR